VERLRQAGRIQHGAVADRDLLVVEWHGGRELRMQPDLLLGEGQGAGVEPAARDDDRRRAGGARRRSADGRLVPNQRTRHRAHAEPLLTVTGSRSRPRSARVCRRRRGPGPAQRREKRGSGGERAVGPPRRARGAPRKKGGPQPKPRGRLPGGALPSPWGWWKRSGSRLAAPITAM